MTEHHIDVKKMEIIFNGMDVQVLLNDRDFTEHIRKVVIDLEAETKSERITLVTKPDWIDFLADSILETFK
jgi:hypothetical protein